MAANSSSTFTELDFTLLKNSLINYLRTQPLFKDYDYAGSDINLLAELLTKNTEKNAFYLNMAIAEAFLDSGQLKASVFSRAKELNYCPRSPRSAKATVQVSFTASGQTQPYIIQKGQSFNTLIKNKAYVFSIPETIVCASANQSFSFTTDVYEGVYVKDAYTFTADVVTPYPRFKITNPQCDTSSLTVAVYEDGSTVADIYKLATTMLGLDDTSKVYFLQTSVDGNYEILFGDGVAGRVPKNGAQIILDYRVCNADAPNGASIFSINFDPTGPVTELISNSLNNPDVETISTAVGGAVQEDIESVRYYAPRAFQVQERAVTASDYEILLKTNFPEISAVNVYGGEEESPPLFGRVIVSLQISGITGLPDTKKQEYYSFLKARAGLTTDILFKDPLFTYLHIDTHVRYNVNISPASKELIQTLVMDAITNYAANNLNDFNVILRYSNLLKAIDAADDSIISNITSVAMYKKTIPQTGVPQNLTLDFSTPFATTPLEDQALGFGSETIIYTSQFTYKGDSVSIKDDGKGNLFIVKPNSDGSFTQVVGVGSVNYDQGIVSLQNFNPDDFDGDFFKVFARPADLDVASARRNILSVETSEINIQVEALRV